MSASVLIVDDEEQVRQLEARVLEHRGYRCVQASSAEEARAQLKRRSVALALIDINLPGESGLSLAKHIAETRRATATLIVTGIDDVAVARQALQSGAYGYLVKPFAPNDLVIQVETALLRRQQELESRFPDVAADLLLV